MASCWNHKQSIKEVLRQGLLWTGLYGLLYSIRQRHGYQTNHLNAPDRRTRFDRIYELGVWRHTVDQVASSGLGSELGQTEVLRASLPHILHDLDVELLIDVGCGDWNWMSQVDLHCNYIGVDIVDALIQRNSSKFSRYNVSFQQLDAVAEELPRCDAVLCREVLFHLSFADGIRLIENVLRNAKWLIATTDTAIWFNSDIPTGDFRMLNLERAPFRLPSPVKIYPDDGLVPGRCLGVWNTSMLQHATLFPAFIK